MEVKIQIKNDKETIPVIVCVNKNDSIVDLIEETTGERLKVENPDPSFFENELFSSFYGRQITPDIAEAVQDMWEYLIYKYHRYDQNA